MVSEVGIPESEAPKIINMLYPDKEINRLMWSQIALNLKPFVIYGLLENAQTIKLLHDRLKTVWTLNSIYFKQLG